ncbi:MAG: hypothetical protein JJE37_13930 [Methyloceanibacter sp.]|nr:hypothetical protein [Methyloceanibacter sp.]
MVRPSQPKGHLELVGARALGPVAPGCPLECRGATRRGHRRQGEGHAGPCGSGKVVLQIALTRLARHYGLIGGEETQRRESGGLRHWGSEDYRPTLDAWNADQRKRRDP